jgi:hypothetical protein
MKPSRFLMLVVCFGMFCSLFGCTVFALEHEEARVSVAWLTESPYKGSTTNVNILFINDSPYELTIYYYGLHFDWMEEDKFAGHSVLDEPVTVAGYGTVTLDPIPVQIPEDVTLGPHSYFVGVDGVDENSDDFTWDSNTLSVVVQTSAAEAYISLESQVDTRVSDATGSNYQSPDAQSFLEDAETAFSQAQTYASRQNYDQAISFLESATFYLDQAETAEQNYAPPQTGEDLLILVGAAVAFVAVVVVVILLTRKGKQPELTPPAEL